MYEVVYTVLSPAGVIRMTTAPATEPPRTYTVGPFGNRLTAEECAVAVAGRGNVGDVSVVGPVEGRKGGG